MRPRRERVEVLVAADLVILTIRNGNLQVLLVERGTEPYKGKLALPGGFLRPGESLDDAARRELAEETGLDATRLPLKQFRAYSAPDRDPRGRVVSVAFLAVAPDLPAPKTRSGTDAAASMWADVSIDLLAELAFDHDVIVADAVERARNEIQYTSLAAAFCPEQFTVSDLQRVFEMIWGVSLDSANFRRKVEQNKGFIVPVGKQKKMSGPGRPAGLYRKGDSEILDRPILRPGRQISG